MTDPASAGGGIKWTGTPDCFTADTFSLQQHKPFTATEKLMIFTVPDVHTYRHHMPNMSVKHAADAYDSMASEHSALIDMSYRFFTARIAAQYTLLIDSGLEIIFQSGDAYADSKAMRADVATGSIRVRKTIGDPWFDPEEGDTYAGYRDLADDHPMAVEWNKSGLLLNDLFRAVHDVFGHYAASAGFGPDGEALAWLTHRSTMPTEALLALWCETRGQNAWTNHKGSHLPISERPFAEQKFGIVLSELI